MKKQLIKRIRNITAVFTLTSMVFCSAYADSIQLTADTSKTVKDIGLEMYGVGGEWGLGAAATLAVDFPTNRVNLKLVKDLKESGLSFGFYRQAGVSSAAYRWKDSIGPVPDRNKNINAANLYSLGVSAFGVAEQVKLTQAFAGKDALINYTVSMVEENPQDIADLAEFFYGDGTINYNGGENWANVRKENGIKDPVNVFAWELGNEYDAGQTIHMYINSDMYVSQCKKFIAAIKSVNPDAKIAISMPMISAPVESRESYWTYNSLLELEPLIDYVVIHGYVTIDNGYKKDREMLVMADDLQKLSGGRIKIINTEYNAQGTLSEKEGTDATALGYGAPMYFAGAKTIVDAICRNVINPAIVSTNFYSAADGTSYSLCYLDDDNKYKLNATGYALSIFQNYGMGKLVDFKLDGFELEKKSDCSGIVIKDDKGYINVILVNNADDKDIHIDFNFDKKYKLCEVQTVKADKPYALDYIGIKEIHRDTVTYKNPEVIDGYDLSKLSFTALKLKEADK